MRLSNPMLPNETAEDSGWACGWGWAPSIPHAPLRARRVCRATTAGAESRAGGACVCAGSKT